MNALAMIPFGAIKNGYFYKPGRGLPAGNVIILPLRTENNLIGAAKARWKGIFSLQYQLRAEDFYGPERLIFSTECTPYSSFTGKNSVAWGISRFFIHPHHICRYSVYAGWNFFTS
ncbi:MAG: hypothetical protein ACOC7U_04715 [Spirochaetota bacterium]